MRRFVPTSSACADCHDDVHDGRFDAASLPKSVDGRTSCARCHVTTAFTNVQWGPSEHERWADYALTGKHATADCRGCHSRRKTPGGPVLRFVKPPKQCAQCHTQPHMGQFADENGVTDCMNCHQSTESFSKLVFDHQRDSRFALDEHHRELDCQSCHRPYKTSTGEVIRYKPLGTECRDCHDSRDLRGSTLP